MIICIAEDRINEESAVRLLLLSLTKHCSDVPIMLYFPPATDDFKCWLTQFSQVTLRSSSFPRYLGWNVKPYALLTLLEEGHKEVWWIDSDIILHHDFRASLSQLTDATLVITEEGLSGNYRDNGYRASAWGLEIGRSWKFCLNTGVLRVTQQHIPLLQKWKQLTETPAYIKAQASPYNEKPLHLWSDQDAFTALLSSREFADIPVKILYRGKDIIQYLGPAGYTLHERFFNLVYGLPAFIHTPGIKSWRRQRTPPNWINIAEYLNYIRLEVSPYNLVASAYRDQVEKDVDWLTCSAQLSKLLRAIGFGNAALTGMPLAILDRIWRSVKQVQKIIL